MLPNYWSMLYFQSLKQKAMEIGRELVPFNKMPPCLMFVSPPLLPSATFQHYRTDVGPRKTTSRDLFQISRNNSIVVCFKVQGEVHSLSLLPSSQFFYKVSTGTSVQTSNVLVVHQFLSIATAPKCFINKQWNLFVPLKFLHTNGTQILDFIQHCSLVRVQAAGSEQCKSLLRHCHGWKVQHGGVMRESHK